MTTHVYVDVDGVLNAISRNPWNDNPTWERDKWQVFRANGYLINYNEDVIDALKEIEALPDVKFHWLTTWCADAPKMLSPVIGIGADWEVIGLDAYMETGYHHSYDAWWKDKAMRAHLEATSPNKVVWIDDDHALYRNVIEADHILKVVPHSERGLENYHFDDIKKFLA